MGAKMHPAPAHAPAWLAIGAAASLAVIVLLAGFSTAKVINANSRVTPCSHDARSPNALLPGESPVTETNADWVDQLFASSCDGPCVGGSACSMTGSKACPSKFTCIPGKRDSVLEPSMPLLLRLSTLITEGNALNTCGVDLVVCFTPASTKRATCVPMSDPCSHEGRSSLAVPVLARDLVFEGVVVEVRKGSDTGAKLATTTVRYNAPIRRVGLCSGFKAGGFNNRPGHNFKYVTFFVEPGGRE